MGKTVLHQREIKRRNRKQGVNWNLTKFHLSKWVKAPHLHLIFRTWNASIKATMMYLVLIKSELCFHITFCEYYWNDCSIPQLYECRVKMVNDGEESKRFQQLTLDCMSEESSPGTFMGKLYFFCSIQSTLLSLVSFAFHHRYTKVITDYSGLVVRSPVFIS